ncbi:hypothetical protein ABBQ32_006693 [Trebouxia sp. C0010 RCD-2024]
MVDGYALGANQSVSAATSKCWQYAMAFICSPGMVCAVLPWYVPNSHQPSRITAAFNTQKRFKDKPNNQL